MMIGEAPTMRDLGAQVPRRALESLRITDGGDQVHFKSIEERRFALHPLPTFKRAHPHRPVTGKSLTDPRSPTAQLGLQGVEP